MNSPERLRMATKLGFGVGAVAEVAVYVAFNSWNFLFYNQVLGLSGTLAGLAVTISLVLDGILEPIVGSLSDRWRSRLGRRHPFLYAAPIPLLISFYLLYAPPAGLSGFGLFLWFTVFATLHRQAMTLYQVPHLALGAELSKDYHQRTIVMSYAALFGVLGGASTGFFGWTWFSRHDGGATLRDNYPGLALGVGLIGAITIFLSAHFTRDQIPKLAQPADNLPRLTLRQLWLEIRDCLTNHNYKNLLLGLFALSATLGTVETLQSHMVLFYWQFPEKVIRGLVLAVIPASIVAFVITARLHRRYDKRHAIIGAALALAFAVATPVSTHQLGIFPGPGTKGLFPALFSFAFIFYGALTILQISVSSALADVADEHELNTGRRQEGVFYAARTFFAKLSTGFGHILAGLAMDLIAFPKQAKPGEIAQDTLAQLGIVYGPISAIPALIATYFYARYAIDRRRHAELQHALAEKRRHAAKGPPSSKPDASPSGAPAPIGG